MRQHNHVNASNQLSVRDGLPANQLRQSHRPSRPAVRAQRRLPEPHGQRPRDVPSPNKPKQSHNPRLSTSEEPHPPATNTLRPLLSTTVTRTERTLSRRRNFRKAKIAGRLSLVEKPLLDQPRALFG